MLRDNLLALSKDDILGLFKTLRQADTCGFNHELVKKTACVEKLLADFPVSDVHAAYDALMQGKIAAAQAGEVRSQAPAPTVDQGAIANQIAGLFATLAAGAVNEDRVREIVNGAVAAALERSPVTRIEVIRPDGSSFTPAGHVRAEFKAILNRARAGLNILLVGPAGSGKTHVAHQVAEALGRKFAAISCTAGMSESALSGWLIPGEGGKFVFLSSDFVRMYEEGGVFLFDEVDAADANTLLFINQALANGSFYLPQREGRTQVVRHPEFVCIAAANTWGNGANGAYAGREKLDEAFLDRFRAGRVAIGYDTEFERAAVDPALLAWGWSVRQRIADLRMQRVMSTRFLLDASKLLAVGESLEDVKGAFFLDWKQEDRAKVEAA